MLQSKFPCPTPHNFRFRKMLVLPTLLRAYFFFLSISHVDWLGATMSEQVVALSSYNNHVHVLFADVMNL